MFYLKALAGIAGFIVILNMIAFALDIAWAMPFGALVVTALFFSLGFWGLFKLASIWLDNIEGK